jgi:circadian clock protein KaiC
VRTDQTKLELQSTGDPAFDDILGGGIPSRSMVVIAGEPGSGKTILTLQLLFHAARQGKKCLYFTTLSEPAIKVMRYMQQFEFFDAELFQKQVLFADLGAVVREGADRTLAELSARVEAHEPAYVAIDSFRAIGELLRSRESVRPFVYDLATQTTSWGATAFLVGEYSRDETHSFAEFAVADGVIHLGSERQELTSVRQVEVQKLRGAAYVTGRHFYEIGAAGLSFYPRVRAPTAQEQQSVVTGARASTGINGLDELLDGGIPQGSTTVVQGGTGAGKTLLSLQFLIEGANKGEKGILFTQEETPDQLRSIASSLGWDLQSLEAKKLLVLQYTSPVELSTDRFLHLARARVEELGAARAVFDSLTTMSLGVPSARRFKEMIYSVAKHMRQAGVTLLMTMETEQLLGSATLSGNGVSFIADNLIQLRYVEIEARLERAISVLKARGVKHNSELRAVRIGEGGLAVLANHFKDLRGVLTGLPSMAPQRCR